MFKINSLFFLLSKKQHDFLKDFKKQSQVCDNNERFIKSPIVTGNLFSDGKMPTTPGGEEKWKALILVF